MGCQIENVYTCCCSLQWPGWKEGSLAFSQDRSIGRDQLGAIVAGWTQTPGLLLRKGGPSLGLLPALLMDSLLWNNKHQVQRHCRQVNSQMVEQSKNVSSYKPLFQETFLFQLFYIMGLAFYGVEQVGSCRLPFVSGLRLEVSSSRRGAINFLSSFSDISPLALSHFVLTGTNRGQGWSQSSDLAITIIPPPLFPRRFDQDSDV